MIEKASEYKLTCLPAARYPDITSPLISPYVSEKLEMLLKSSHLDIMIERQIERKEKRETKYCINRDNCDVYMYYYVGDPDRCLQLIEKRVNTTGTNITKEATAYNEG